MPYQSNNVKRLISLFGAILLINLAQAQFKQIAESTAFKEPEEGYAKVLQMKNGNTLFIVVTNKKGIDVRVYDANHKEVAVNNIYPSYGKLSNGGSIGIFEINGD